jgi:arylsulfatase A-like enzyme
MAYLTSDDLSLHYTDDGAGEAIITLHGLSECGRYWTLPGITDRLVAAGYRVINMDMRGHGLSRSKGADKGYDVDTLAGDIDRLANGPYDRSPTGRGFDYFYGFMAGETSQWEPALWENTNPISPPHVENYEDYHLTEGMADKAITWMRRHLAMNPDRPFLMWWTPGAVHGPHHVAKKWAEKYKGTFDDGWDAYQQRVFERRSQRFRYL